MPSVVNEHNKNLLSLYGLLLKKELKSYAVVRLNNSNSDLRVNNGLYERLLYAANNFNSIHDLNLPKVTFGIEFEFIGSKSPGDLLNFNTAMSELLHEKYFYSGTYTHNEGTSWVLGRDSSIKTSDQVLLEPFGYELSSPKLDLFNADDIAIVSKVIDYAKQYLYAYVNKSCGTHVHIGLKHSNIFRGSLCDLLSAYSVMEKTVFDPVVPTSRRKNRFCKPTQPWLRNKYQKLSSRFCEFNYDGKCRNLHFEFRQLEGTLNINTIVYWAQLQAYILYDLLDNINDHEYIQSLMKKNIFEILLHYNFDKSLVSFFIKRVIDFRSRSLLQTNDTSQQS